MTLPALDESAVKETVWAADPALLALEKELPDAVTAAKLDRGEMTLTIGREHLIAVAKLLQKNHYNFLEDVTGVDWYPSEPRFQVSYHILSHSLKRRLRLAVRLTSIDPTVETMTTVWPSANFYEREVFDLFGVNFAGHPNMRRIMLPDEWEGHPLRKDYPVEGYR